jgi:nitrogen regulatory protein P-II 1
MKEVKAFIKPHKLDDVVLSLHRIEGLSGLSVSAIRGFGRGRGHTSPDHETEEILGFIEHLKIEIICHDELVERVIKTIELTAHTGLRGDGKIYVLPVEDAVRISSGERGESAI